MSVEMQPYVVHRLLNQRARLKAKSPELEILPEPTPWEPDSDAYDTELDDEKEVQERRDEHEKKTQMDKGIGLQMYKKVCSDISTAPQSTIMYNLAGKNIKISERQMGATNLTGLMCALQSNNHLKSIDLSNNHLGYHGGRELATVLLTNYTVTHLNLSKNGFGGFSVAAFLAKLLRTNEILTHLDISHNGFTDEDAKYIASGIEANEGLIQLNLSHNNLCEGGATYLGKAIAVNDTIEDLDLSWNSIRRKGAVTLCKAIKRNFSLKKLNLSWNGLCYEGALAVRDALSTNKHLVEIDISNNRINWEGALFIAEMLEKNCYLEVLRMGNNPLTTTGCLDIIDAISRNENSGLRLLDLNEVPVTQEFVVMYKRLQQNEDREAKFDVIHGQIVPHHDVLGMRFERKIHPMQKIINYMYEKELRPLELLKMFDKEGTFKITQAQLLERLREKGIDIKSWEEKELMSYIASGAEMMSEDSLIDYKKLVDSVVSQIDNERNHRIAAREHSKNMQQLHDRILNAPLPPLNVDAALVHITRGRSKPSEDFNAKKMIEECLTEAIHDRLANSFQSKMAMAKNIKMIDVNKHTTPVLANFNKMEGSDDVAALLSPRPNFKVLMGSPLNRVKSRKTRSLRTKRSKLPEMRQSADL